MNRRIRNGQARRLFASEKDGAPAGKRKMAQVLLPDAALAVYFACDRASGLGMEAAPRVIAGSWAGSSRLDRIQAAPQGSFLILSCMRPFEMAENTEEYILLTEGWP